METGLKSLGRKGIGNHRLAVYVGISVCAHALFFLVSIWLVQFRVPYTAQEVVQVDLVSFAPGEPGGPFVPQPEKASVSSPSFPPEPPVETAAVSSAVEPAETTVPAEPEPVQVLKPDVSLKAKPKNLEELMAQTSEAEPVPKPHPTPEPKPKPAAPPAEKKQEAAPEKKSGPIPEQKLAEAMKRLAKEVEKQDRASSVHGTGTGPLTGSGDGAGSGRNRGTPLDFYKLVLQSSIQQNWVFNEMLAGLDQNLEVRILIKILKNGEIRDLIFETRSGNSYLDQSAKRAIQRANPLPSLPPGMASYDVVVIFTPKGLR